MRASSFIILVVSGLSLQVSQTLVSTALVSTALVSTALVQLSCPVPSDKQDPSSIFSLRSTSTNHSTKVASAYLKANYFQHGGKYQQALQAYQYLFSLNAPDYIYDGYLRLLSQTNQFEKINELINKTQKLFQGKDNLDIQLINVQSLLNTNQNKQARTILDTLNAQYPKNKHIIHLSTILYEKTNNPARAIAELDSILQETGDFFLYFRKAQIFSHIKAQAQALEAINNSLKIRPGFGKGVLFKALLLEQMQQVDQAIEAYKTYLNITGYNQAVIKQLVGLFFTQKKFDQAAEQLQKIGVHGKTEHNQVMPAEYHFDLALLWRNAKKIKQALPHARKALEIRSDFHQAKVLLNDILFDLNQEDEILKLSENWLNQTPNDTTTIYKLIEFANKRPKKIPHIKVIQLLEKVQKNNAQSVALALAIADLLLQTKRHNKALEAYSNAFALTTNEQLHARIFFQKAFIYAHMHTKPSKKDLEKALLELKKSETLRAIYLPSIHLKAECLSALDQLDSALIAIEKTLVHINKMTPSYHACVLDTKALIYKKQKKYRLEKETLEKAHKLAPQDKTIEEHLQNAKSRQ